MGRKSPQMQAIDRYVGQKIKWHRIQQGLSQQALAQKVDISYQQLHKYENGTNSVSASRLAELANALNTRPSSFFEGYEDDGGDVKLIDSESQRQQMLLVKYFSRIRSSKQREAIQNVIRSFSES
tara:strand:+ start:357 stop:731 length:375 start_codon:yes stop_codon:yes gene_type:complete